MSAIAWLLPTPQLLADTHVSHRLVTIAWLPQILSTGKYSVTG